MIGGAQASSSAMEKSTYTSLSLGSKAPHALITGDVEDAAHASLPTRPSVTHLVVALDADRRVKRTFKYLAAVLDGAWIIDVACTSGRAGCVANVVPQSLPVN